MRLKSQLDTKELLLLESETKSQGKNMVVAYILWYFLGYFGGHRFYMKKTGSAIAMLILSITLIGMIATFIWWIVDAFLLHNWVKEHNRQVEAKIVNQLISAPKQPPAPYSF
ncbi:TM2 domain-containing protein [Cohnella sp. AR92]|uniref:TM2 domain-containing protein n=1 Tax=Cohnella sp. AR92 TaxID=648716 RepID=UPI000F8EEA7F|nr:TM2 domain-containing protein [Cohnella sp. AR92]RUS46110.1 TM2 domain-containing protein [Cohnella sp. AR92]